ncbi:hypothetical protein D3C72_1314910 [compost metagenome]
MPAAAVVAALVAAAGAPGAAASGAGAPLPADLIYAISAAASSSLIGSFGITGPKPFTRRACGSVISLCRKASSTAALLPSAKVSVLPYKPFHVGPTPGLPSMLWHAVQPLLCASARPFSTMPASPAAPGAAAAIAAGGAAAFASAMAKVCCFASQASYAAGSSTTTMPRML